MRLRTFGGLSIEGLDAPTPFGPRPLGLLAMVAASGRQGISRDRVIGILWPETGEEQARHTLSQTLYRLRQAAGHDLVAGTVTLRLDPGLASDVGEFRDAMATGHLDLAARLHSGRFLEGFYLPGAPEFERWVEAERASIEREAMAAVERLAREAEAADQPAEAVTWWQRLVAHDPLSARYTVGAMRALAAAGDRSGALARARAHRELMQRELGAEPEPAVRLLEASLRAAIAEPVAHPPAPPQAPARPPGTAAVGSGTSPLPARPRTGRRMMGLLVAAAIVVMVVAALLRGGSGGMGGPPFLAVGQIRTEPPGDTTRIGPILRDMLATSLGGIEGLQVVANSRLVELTPRGADTVPGMTTDAARRAGANEIIEGELSTAPDGLVLSLRRVTLGRGVVRRGYVIRAKDRYALVDSAAAAIARDLRLIPPAQTVAALRTTSPAAYTLYDEGLRAYYGYDAPAAYRLMTAALARDSTFAMAAFYAWQLSRNLADESTATRAMRRVEALAPRAIESERLLIQGSLAEVEAPLRTAVAVAETLTVKYPALPEGHMLLGVVRARQGDWAGSVAAYRQAFALDSIAGALAGPYCRICTALAGMGDAYLWWDSAGAAARVARKLIALRPRDPQTWINLVEPLLRLGRRIEAESAFVTANRATNPDAFPSLLHRDLIRWGQYAEVDRRLLDGLESRSADVRGESWWLLLLSLRDQGRLREADTLIHRWRVPNTTRSIPHPEPDPIDLAMLGMEMGRPEATIRVFHEGAERALHQATLPSYRARHAAWYLVLEGTARMAAGDTAIVRRLADSLERVGEASAFGRDPRLHYVLRGLLLQREGRHAEAVDAFRRSLFSLTDGYTRTNLMMARSLLALRRPAEAIAVLQPAIRGGVDGSNTYVSRSELHEALAQAFEQAGRADSARVHWAMVERSWRRADPPFRERYQQARRKAGL
ncbi:MAG TPA: BTAD domain-containing putative transcriptional regulator [Gemmatimonadales bacterium]